MTDRTMTARPRQARARSQSTWFLQNRTGFEDSEEALSQFLARRAGSALFWKGFQLAGSKIVFLARTLILAWLLAPDDFGLLAIALIAVDTLSSLTDIGMVPALVQHREC
jgi:hypothetical protein